MSVKHLSVWSQEFDSLPTHKFMTWNYRIMKHTTTVGSKGEFESFGIHEVYYDEDGKIMNWTEQAIVTGDSVEELLSVLKTIRKDVVRSKDAILDYSMKPESDALDVIVETDENGHDFQCNYDINGKCDCFKNPEVAKQGKDWVEDVKKSFNDNIGKEIKVE